jgi:hypothetical protein
MSEKKPITITDLAGKNVEIKESEKSIKKKEEKYFIDLITNLCAVEAHSRAMFNSGVDTTVYDNMYIQIITTLLDKIYNPLQKNIIIWWVFDALSPEGEVYPLLDENNKKHIINTPLQLYKFIKQYDGR